MNRKEILKKASDLTSTERDAEYGSWYRNACDVGVVWGIILRSKDYKMPPPSPEQVALMMDAVKTVRLAHNPDHEDSWVDKCGYSALGGEKISKGK